MTDLRQELCGYIEAMPERNLRVLKPLLLVLSDPSYTVETDLSAEEIAVIDAGMEEYRTDPDSFVSLDSLRR